MNKNKETIKKVSAKVHEELLNTSHLFIDETVATLSRMQKITGKVIKKSEPILEKQIEITFDAVEALKDQAGKGGKRALKLLGLTKQYNKISNTIAEKIDAMPSAGEVIEDAKELVGKAKNEVEDTIEVIGKKLNIEETLKFGKNEKTAKASAVKTAKKVTAKVKALKTVAKKTAKKVVAKTTVAKKATNTTKAKVAKKIAVVTKPVAKKTAKKVVAKKATPTKAKVAKKVAVVAKPVAKKTAKKVVAKVAVAKKATPVVKANVAKKVEVVAKPVAKKIAKKVESKTKVAVAKKVAVAAKVQIAKSELTQIKGIGESLAGIMADNGIKTIIELQNATPTALKVIATKAGNRYKTFDTNNWITAAKAIAK